LAFRQAIKRAGLEVPGKLTLHSLRHGFASLLIAKGLNVVYVSRQLGHANPTVTLDTYAHLFERADHAHTAHDALEASYSGMLATSRPAANWGGALVAARRQGAPVRMIGCRP
jgi:hypothetical protein